MLNIDEVGDVHSRVNQLVDHFCQGNKAAFGRQADIQSGVLAGIIGGRKNKPSFEVLQRLFTAYPTVNPTWLLFGRGSMLNADTNAESQHPAQLKKGVDATLSRLSLIKDKLAFFKWQHEELVAKASEMRPDGKRNLQPEEQIAYNKILEQQHAIRASANPLREEMISLTNQLNDQNKYFDFVLDNLSLLEPTLSSIYRIIGEAEFNRPYNGLLTQRLDISEETALRLITEGKLRSVNVGEEGYRVSEQAVREFLGEA